MGEIDIPCENQVEFFPLYLNAHTAIFLILAEKKTKKTKRKCCFSCCVSKQINKSLND